MQAHPRARDGTLEPRVAINVARSHRTFGTAAHPCLSLNQNGGEKRASSLTPGFSATVHGGADLPSNAMYGFQCAVKCCRGILGLVPIWTPIPPQLGGGFRPTCCAAHFAASANYFPPARKHAIVSVATVPHALITARAKLEISRLTSPSSVLCFHDTLGRHT